MATLIADIETNGYLEDLDRVWTIQLGDADTDEVTVYADQPGFPPLHEAILRLEAADRIVSHNGVKFDYPALLKVYPGILIRRSQIFDTLLAGRLQDPEERGQSLEAWGNRLGIAKGSYAGTFAHFDQELVDYARQDVVVGRAVYHKVKIVDTWGQSLQLEHDTAWAIAEQELNGFRIDVPAAQALEAELRGQTAAMTVALRDVFPPRWVRKEKGTFVPKSDNRSQGYVKGCPLTKVRLETFNPASRIQVGQRLILAGWKPRKFGADGHPTVDEEVLATLPFPEARRLVEFFEVAKLLGQLSDGKNGWLKLVRPNGRVYGGVITNGAVTGRMAHVAPNLAQVSSDPRARRLWIPREGWVLVGCDADGIEARLLGHYLARYDGGAFIKMLLEGTKEAGTDIHSANTAAVNRRDYPVDRDGGKKLLYALIYGAGDAKLGLIVSDNIRAQGLPAPKRSAYAIGRHVRAALATSMVGIDKLIEAIGEAVSNKGYLVGLDSRRLHSRSPHSALNTLLQGAGAVVMKKALCLFDAAPDKPRSPWAYCVNVHDEVQLEAAPEIAEELGRRFAECITLAGQHFNLRCPLAGSYKVGNNWSETH